MTKRYRRDPGAEVPIDVERGDDLWLFLMILRRAMLMVVRWIEKYGEARNAS